MAGEKKLFPSGRLIAVALAAGAIAGAVAVYVSGGLPGNNAGDARTAADLACAAKSERAQAVAAAATGEVAALLPADPPQSVADLAFTAPDGKPARLADHAGRVVLLNLWATWCVPCRVEMPELNTLQKEKGGDAFEVVAVNVDTGDDAKPKAFLADTGVDALSLYRDNTLDLFNDLKVRGLALGLPVTLLVDRDGCLLAHMNGPAEWASADAFRLVDAATAD